MRNLAVVNNIMVDGGIVLGKDYRFVWFPGFVVLICNVQELLWFLPKSANFSKICNTRYLGSE